MSNLTVKNSIKVFLLGIVVVVYIWVVWSAVTSTMSNFANTFTVGADAKSATQEKINNMRRELRAADNYLQDLSLAAVSNGEVPSILNNIESQGLGEIEVSVNNVSEDVQSGVVSISLVFDCSLRECIDVAQRVSVIKPVIGVHSLALLQQDDGIWSASMTITIPMAISDM